MANLNGKRNIMIVNAALDLGGAEVVIANLCRHLSPDLFRVYVAVLRYPGKIAEELAGEGRRIINLGNGSRGANYTTALKLLSLARELRIDLIHSHCRAAFLDCSFCKVFNPQMKFVHTFHYGNFPHVKFRYRVMDSLASRKADKLVAVGYEQGRTIRAHYDIADSRIETIWNGIDYRADAEPGILNGFIKGRTVIGTIANLIEQKGMDQLLATAALLKSRRSDFVFVVVGDGPLRESLEKKKQELGLDDVVVFLGKMPNAAARALPCFDIFFQPSNWEAMSIVILEAMACAKPVVATRVGDNPIVVFDGGNGLLVEPRDPPGMAASLERLLSSPELRARFGKRSRELFALSFSAERMAARYDRLFEEVLEPDMERKYRL